MAGQIHISEVLLKMRSGNGKPFVLDFIRSSGNKKGSIKRVKRALYGSPKIKIVRSTKNRKALHTEKGTIPINDLEKDANQGGYITPLISHITGFNNQKVIH